MSKNIQRKRRRAKGEGCIHQLKDGRWEARITIGYKQNGQAIQKTFSSKRQDIVVQKLNEFKAEMKKFDSSYVVNYTIKQWLNIWYNSYVINNVKVSTRVSYEGIIKNHLVPHIGNIKLINLRKVQIEEMYNKLLINTDSKKGLAISTIENIHLVLHKALQEALEREYIIKNPASIAKVPTLKSQNVKKEEIKIYSKAEQSKLIEVAKQDNIYGIVVIFALYTGMRKGEILGLQWNDIDFNKKTIRINKQLRRVKNYDDYDNKKTILGLEYNTKTENSTRVVPMLNILEKHLKQHLQMQMYYKKLFGANYNNNNMVFCKEDGSFLDPDTVLAKYQKLAEKANIKKCTFHALRHTFATRALESKMPVKVLSSILGHSKVEFTLEVYTHVLDELKTNEMDNLENYLKTIAV